MDPFKPYQPKSRNVLPKLTVADAQAVALQAIAFIAGDEDVLSRFFALSGCGGDELRQRLGDPVFLGAVLDFILGDEATVIAFAEQAGFAPETPGLARALLPGAPAESGT